MDAEELAREMLRAADTEQYWDPPQQRAVHLLPYARALIEAEKALTHAESYAPEWITERPSPTLLSLRSLLEKAK